MHVTITCDFMIEVSHNSREKLKTLYVHTKEFFGTTARFITLCKKPAGILAFKVKTLKLIGF